MTKRVKTKKIKNIELSSNQVGHLIDGAVENLVDLKIHSDETGHRFLLILECLADDSCIPVNKEPKTDKEYFDIICAHEIAELDRYIEVILPIKLEDGKMYRGFSTITMDKTNIGNFVDSLSKLEDHWAGIYSRMEEEEDFTNKTKNKNFIEGNDTVN